MLDIARNEAGAIAIKGRFDASEAARVEAFLDRIEASDQLDLSGLEYVSSLGLGVLLKTQKRLRDHGHGLLLVGMPAHIREIFRFSGFDRVFEIAPP
jgi:anti-sigma B factor antagonist